MYMPLPPDAQLRYLEERLPHQKTEASRRFVERCIERVRAKIARQRLKITP